MDISARPIRVRPTVRPRVTLAQIAAQLGVAELSPATIVSGITLSSAEVEVGDLYAALPGANVHGANYARDAVTRGAVALLTDPAGAELIGTPAVPVFVVGDPRSLLPALSGFIYDTPREALRMVGISGTQGKTTATYLAEAALSGAGEKAAVIGTIGTRINGRPAASTLTTPEAPQLQALLAVMREEGVDVCSMEVSSHALVKGRVDGLIFDVAVFLNLGRDHLDFHANLEEYFEAKAKLFTPQHARRAVINIDDEHGRRLIERSAIPVTTFSTAGIHADWQAINIRPHRLGTDVDVIAPSGRERALHVPLPGVFNVSNALAVLAALATTDEMFDHLAAGIAECTGVPGRMERVDVGQEFTAIVDYAHKPDAVEAVLKALRPVTAGRLIIVLGAGGDRDQGKRSIMGEVAGGYADILIVTDDNPRNENPASIRQMILAGAGQTAATVFDISGRGTAIAAAVDMATPGDTIIVAGKGHEKGQEINGEVHPFDDRLEVSEQIGRKLNS